VVGGDTVGACRFVEIFPYGVRAVDPGDVPAEVCGEALLASVKSSIEGSPPAPSSGEFCCFKFLGSFGLVLPLEVSVRLLTASCRKVARVVGSDADRVNLAPVLLLMVRIMLLAPIALPL